MESTSGETAGSVKLRNTPYPNSTAATATLCEKDPDSRKTHGMRRTTFHTHISGAANNHPNSNDAYCVPSAVGSVERNRRHSDSGSDFASVPYAPQYFGEKNAVWRTFWRRRSSTTSTTGNPTPNMTIATIERYAAM
mmetsp:Transcript_1796/g.1896  ORF Transcript_1796/g.1896 Transcript_1796/m.1896 type:complete len:137 (-) Transcript_1796:134-544(-)